MPEVLVKLGNFSGVDQWKLLNFAFIFLVKFGPCAVKSDETVEMKMDPRGVARQKCADYLFDKDPLLNNNE